MDRDTKIALRKVERAGFGHETRVPIHYLLSIFDEQNVASLIARVALGQELKTTIKESTKDQRVIDARIGYDRLVEPLDFVRDRIEDLEILYGGELPHKTATVTFKILEGGGDI